MGTVSIYESRRTNFEKCKWWNRSTINGSVPLQTIAYQYSPTGEFWADEEDDLNMSLRSTGDIKYEGLQITISTYDDIWGKIHEEDLVLYKHRIWRVSAIRLKRDWKRSQFSRNNVDGKKVLYLVS